MTKPIVFNYRKYEELRQAYKDLLMDNQKLMDDNRRLRNQLTNLEIKLRIKEADDDRKNNI